MNPKHKKEDKRETAKYTKTHWRGRRRAFVCPSEKAKPSYTRGRKRTEAKSWVYAEYREQAKASKMYVRE